MAEITAALWLIIGIATAILAAQEAHREGISVHWGWWLVFVALGPVIPVLAAIVVLLAPRRRGW